MLKFEDFKKVALLPNALNNVKGGETIEIVGGNTTADGTTVDISVDGYVYCDIEDGNSKLFF